MSAPVIVAKGVCKSFGSHPVLDGLDLSIPPGAVVGLVGANGAGKSTLLKCLLGLLRIDGGTARVFDEDPWHLSALAKSRLGYVPQTVQLYPWMRIDQIVGYTAAFYERWDKSWANSLLDRWRLQGHDRVSTMSQGQLQKLALVLALGHQPELLILDEPVASLDPLARREFLRSLIEMTMNHQCTVLFSTHITSDLERVASHVAILKSGRLSLFDELDIVKDQVKRLRITARRELPNSFTVRGALHTQRSGQQAVISVAGVDEALLEELRTTWQADVTVEDLNLEEIFLELHHV